MKVKWLHNLLHWRSRKAVLERLARYCGKS